MSRRLVHLILAALMLVLTPGAGAAMKAQPPRPGALHEPGPDRVAPSELNREIDRVLERREYAWRLPRHETATEKTGWLGGWFESIRKWFRGVWRWLDDMIQRLIDWLLRRPNEPHEPAGGGAGAIAKDLLYVLVAVAVVFVAWLAWRQRRRRKGTVVSATAVETVPDLHSEDVSADQLPEDRWLALARELLEKGELRLSLRASYLASLAHLGQRELLAIARHKSNLDYRRELNRRASQRREMLGAFEENVLSFERAWYGRAAVTPEVVNRFTTNLEVIRAGAGPGAKA